MDRTITRETIEYATAEDLLGDAINVGKIHQRIQSEWAYWFNSYGGWETALWNASVLYLEKFLKNHGMFKDCDIYYDFELNGPEMAGAISSIMPDLVLDQ